MLSGGKVDRDQSQTRGASARNQQVIAQLRHLPKALPASQYTQRAHKEDSMADAKKCAMDGCLCTAPAGQKYCSTYCEAAKGSIKLQCDCGHPACASQKL